jgi:uncharacterized protein YndB with AHSA1/START domain
MPSARRTRTIAASAQELWEVLGDPHHLPRWWPRVSRVESVDEHAFTEVLMSEKGKMVRADFKLLDAGPQRVVWAQQVENTPFSRILSSAETEVSLASLDTDGPPSTEVTIELRQTLHGFLARLGSHLVRRAAGSTIEEALDGLERIMGRPA